MKKRRTKPYTEEQREEILAKLAARAPEIGREKAMEEIGVPKSTIYAWTYKRKPQGKRLRGKYKKRIKKLQRPIHQISLDQLEEAPVKVAGGKIRVVIMDGTAKDCAEAISGMFGGN